MNTFFADKAARVMMLLLMFVAVIALAAYARLTFQQATYGVIGPTLISMSGTGEVMAIPDIGEFSFSVQAEAETAAAAQQQSGEAMNAVLAFLSEQGVAERDITTTGYNLFPRYRFEPRPCPPGSSWCPPGEQIQDGFTVTQTISVKVRNLDEAGMLLSGVGERGATNVSGLRFTVDDTVALEAEARSLAMVEAHTKAKAVADTLGLRIVRVTGFYEEDGRYQPMPYGMGGDMMVRSMEADFAGPSVPTGEQTITSRVTLTFEMQ